jgi:shikimate dehydrogenase
MKLSSASGISGGVRVGAVVGRPIAHSLSPVIHNAWIEALGLDAAYVTFAPPDDGAFRTLIEAGRAGMLAGLNVTAPFKELAFSTADEASATARLSASANLLVFRDGRVLADSTDGLGLLRGLKEQAPALEMAGRPVVLLGAGGAARAAAAALAGAGAAVRIVNRTAERAEAVARDVGKEVSVWTDRAAALSGAVLVVNALSAPPDLDAGDLDEGTVVMDMTYKPLITPLLAAAKARGLTIVDGLSMLIGQAGPSFEAIFGVAAPDVDIRPRVLAVLGEAG